MWNKTGYVKINDPDLAFIKKEYDLVRPTYLDLQNMPAKVVEVFHEFKLQENLRQQTEIDAASRGH